jgi:hypothetical protein
LSLGVSLRWSSVENTLFRLKALLYLGKKAETPEDENRKASLYAHEGVRREKKSGECKTKKVCG